MIKFSEIGFYNCGFAPVKSKGQWGFINREGKIAINCQYEKVNRFSGTLASVRKDNKWAFIDTSGANVCDFQYDDVGCFSEGLAPVRKNNKWGVINEKGEVVIPFTYEFIDDFSEKLAVAKLNGKYGYIDSSNNVNLPFGYEIANRFSSDIAYVDCGKGKHGYITHNGKFIIEFDKNSYPQKALNNRYIVVFHSKNMIQGSWSILNDKGEVIKESIKCSKIGVFNEGGAPIKDYNHKWGIIDVNGEIKVPFEYEHVSVIFDGLAYAIRNKKAGYIDINNNQVIPFKYSAVTDFSEGLAHTNFNKWNSMVIDTKGNTVFELQKELSLKNVIRFLSAKWEEL